MTKSFFEINLKKIQSHSKLIGDIIKCFRKVCLRLDLKKCWFAVTDTRFWKQVGRSEIYFILVIYEIFVQVKLLETKLQSIEETQERKLRINTLESNEETKKEIYGESKLESSGETREENNGAIKLESNKGGVPISDTF